MCVKKSLIPTFTTFNYNSMLDSIKELLLLLRIPLCSIDSKHNYMLLQIIIINYTFMFFSFQVCIVLLKFW